MVNINNQKTISKMQWEDFNNFILSIEADYPKTFKLTSNQAKIWWDALKDFDIEDLKKKYDNHKKGNWSYTEPKLPYLLQGLKNIESKQQSGKSFLYCNHCNKVFEYPLEETEFEECMERCLRIKYLTRTAAKYNINLDKYFRTNNLYSLSLAEIDKSYSRFILDVYKSKDKMKPKELFAIESLIKNNPSEYSYQESLKVSR